MHLLFTFSDGANLSSSFITDNAKITECFYNQLKYADNSAQLLVPFNENLCDRLKAEISRKTKVQIVDGTSVVFTGYVRNTIGFTKTQRNQPFTLEIVSPSLLLDYTYSGTMIHYADARLSDVVSALLSFTPFSGTINVNILENKTIPLFTFHDGSNVKEELTELLYEYGYGFDFDNNGGFYITEIFKNPIWEIEQKFNGDNCLNQIQQTVKEDTYRAVSVEWTKIERKNDEVIFEDTTGATAQHDAEIRINPQSYYLDAVENYLEYASKYQSVEYIQSSRAIIQYNDADGIDERFENLGNQGLLSIKNNTNSLKMIYQLKVLGNGYFAISKNQTKVGSNGKEQKISAKYIQTDEDASYFARKIGDYNNYANFTILITSKTKYDCGSFVEVSDSGIGTIRARIVKRIWDIKFNTYTYTLESISEYTPIETYTRKQTVISAGDGGINLKDKVNEISDRVDGIVTDTVSCTADRLSYVIKTDSDGKAIADFDFSTTITLRQNSDELDFTIGAMPLPAGWSYKVVGKQILFHVDEGAIVRSDTFNIPVQYRQGIEEQLYVDENGNQYVDENNAPYGYIVRSETYTQWNLYFTYFGDGGGIYRGVVLNLENIPQIANLGDFFTWGGDNVESDLSLDGKFLKSAVYKYVGTSHTYHWNIDNSNEHGLIAMSDVLSIANEDLRNNNSKVWEYLDHLTANTIFAKLLSVSQAFIQNLTVSDAFIQNLKVAQGLFENIIVSGTISGATGKVHNLDITGDSHFEGTIDSGPLLLSDSNPTPESHDYPAGEYIDEQILFNMAQKNINGFYGNYEFDVFSFSEVPYKGAWLRLILYKNGTEIYREEKYCGNNPSYYGRYTYQLTYNLHYEFTLPSGTKTLKLRGLPTQKPADIGLVYALDDGILRIVK